MNTWRNRNAFFDKWSNLPLPPQEMEEFFTFVEDAFADAAAGYQATSSAITENVWSDAKQTGGFGLAIGQLVANLAFVGLELPDDRGDDLLDDGLQVFSVERDFHEKGANENGPLVCGIPAVRSLPHF